jgi:L-asparaginase / beta-aspartyl-peptidase
MKRKKWPYVPHLTALVAVVIVAYGYYLSATREPEMPKYAFAIHGGAGTILKKNMTPELEAEYEKTLLQALAAGEVILKAGGTSLDAVSAALVIMEDSPLFNAGKGAVFNHEGEIELDASIMDGATLAAGAVAGVRHVKNPVLLARIVMEKSKHVFLVGEGAEAFAAANGVALVDEAYFQTERRRKELERVKNTGARALDVEYEPETKYGTVGAVALDSNGNLAAATSTGGLTNKAWGRVGDSPIIGAGTYANKFCAVSGTGDGEFFIRTTAARTICAEVEMRDKSVYSASFDLIHTTLVQMKAEGGVIAIDRDGHLALVFNTAGMYRAWVKAGEQPHVEIYRD